MNKINHLILILGFLFTGVASFAQDPNPKFTEAENAYASKDLDNTRFALQGALGEIYKAIGKDILATFPKKLKEYAFVEKQDNVTGALGFAGLFIHREYGNDTQGGELEVMSDSPLLAALNTILALPAMMGSTDPNQKRLKIGGYKSILQKETDDKGVISYTLQIPINQTLVTVKTKGLSDENDIISFGNSLPLDQIDKMSN